MEGLLEQWTGRSTSDTYKVLLMCSSCCKNSNNSPGCSEEEKNQWPHDLIDLALANSNLKQVFMVELHL